MSQIKRTHLKTIKGVMYELVHMQGDMSGYSDKQTNEGWYLATLTGVWSKDGQDRSNRTVRNFYNDIDTSFPFGMVKKAYAESDNIIELCVNLGFTGLINHPQRSYKYISEVATSYDLVIDRSLVPSEELGNVYAISVSKAK